MDKCKYYLNLDGVTKVFNSDLELTEFIKSGIDADTNELGVGIKTEIGVDKNGNKEYRFFYGDSYTKNKNEVRVTNNYEPSEYSIHEGDLSGLSKEDRIKLFKAQDSVIPKEGKIVNRSKSSLDGIKHRLNLANRGWVVLKEQSSHNQAFKSNNYQEIKEFADKNGLGTVYQNTSNKVLEGDIQPGEYYTKGITLIKKQDSLRIKFSKTGEGLQTKQDEVLDIIKKGIDPFSESYIRGDDFFKEKHIIDEELRLLSPYFADKEFKENFSEYLLENDIELKELAKINPEEAKKKAYALVDKKLESDKRMYNLSIIVSDNMQNLISGKTKFNLNDIIKGIAAYNLNTSDPKLIEDYISKISDSDKEQLKIKFEKWADKIRSSKDKYLSRVNLSKSIKIGEHPGIYSWMSYVSVSPEGIPDIYEIKVSRDKFEDWHSAKLITTDYKLGLNRQLLQNRVSTADSSLFILPVIFPTDINDQIIIKNIYIDNPIDRSRRDANANLDAGGEITYRLRQLLPADTIENQADSEVLDKLNQEILDLFFPKYNFRTKITNLNWENKYKEILKDSEKEPKLVIYDSIDKRPLEEPNTPEGRERFKKVVEDYYKKASEAKHTQMIDLQKSILTAKKGLSQHGKMINFGRTSEELQNTFGKYIDDNWSLVTGRPELINSGIFVFKNTSNNSYEIVSITINDLKQVNNLVGTNNTILGKFRTNESLRGDKKILEASNSNIETMKALTVINNNPDLVHGYTLNGIKVFNILENKAEFHDIDVDLYNFNLLINEAKKYKTIENNFGKNGKLKTTETFKWLYDEILHVANATADTKFRAEIDKLGTVDEYSDNKTKLNKMLELRNLLYNKYKYLGTSNQAEIQDFSKPEEYLHYLVSAGITYYTGIDGIFDYDMPQYGIRVGDMTHWLKSVLFGTAPDYDKNGNKIVGIFQGSHFTTADANQSVYMGKLHELITIASNKLRSDYNKRKSIIIKSTNEYYDSIGRSDLEKILLGNADQYHKIFYETNAVNEISKDFKIKNPWDNKAKLNDPERRYLKQFIYNQYVSKFGADENLDTFAKFEKSTELKQLLDLENRDTLDLLLKVPLIKKQSLSKYKSLTTDGLRKFIGQRWDEMMSDLDPRNLTSVERDEERQKIGFYQSVNGFRKMFNQFDFQESEENRHKLIEQYGSEYFEVNLDTIALKYAFETIREKQFNAVLPTIYSAITVMKYHGWQTGKHTETQKALEDFFNQMKVSLFDVSVIKGKEVEESLNLVKKIQHITSLMTIALRPTMMIKELVVGTIRNASYAWSKVYGHDTFEASDLIKAYELFFSGQEDFNKIMELNNEYAIANRDLHEVVSKTKVDRYGLNFMSNAFYWCNTFPDYINRLSLFLAKMQKDGTYDAHSINNEGQLVYDPSKDERYSYYFKMRDRYGMDFHKTDSKYNDQRNKYLYAIDDYNAELYALNEKPLTEKDNLPQAYSHKERSNIKTFADTAYGYYDRNLSPLEKFLPTGVIFGQFLTFWPAKVKYYFGKEGSKASREYRTQKTIEDADGNKIPLFAKWTVDKEGEMYLEEVPESELGSEDARVEAYEWKGELNEGLMYSLGYVARDLFSGHLDETDPQRMQQAKLMVHDLLLMFSSIALGSLLYQDLKKSKTDATKYDQYERLAMKVMYKSTNEFDPFGNTLGSIQAEPAFVSTLATVKKDFGTMISGKTSLAKFLHNNIQFAELLPNPVTKN